ncbi:DUF6303 family protein [Streptomyces sp. NBC_00237]|uniref:DUF6303 family protein n=1 Tax=Streptomyces sp. NBC_00237 TaxID=2975687 RepID=UPI0022505421|nr:DUF6303 family protein [Streptomyces sp. NBC_00237]MCX5202414.1 DUF6303 family protein [Streptomyces sp. NBC_00237]
MSTPTTAQMSRLCCDLGPGVTVGDPRRARWQLHVVVYGPGDWPAHYWPVSHRDTIPTPDERAAALAEFGYQPAPGTRWEWEESETPPYHGHPALTSVFATIRIVPIDRPGRTS